MKFIFTEVEKGRGLISRVDEYLSRLSHVELSMRLGRSDVSADEYAQILGGCVLEWEEQEIIRLGPVMEKAEKIIDGLGMLSDDIYVVKTDGSDEWNSAYTRGSTIFLPPNKLAYEEGKLLSLVLHEFFHAYFRGREDIHEELYSLAGFSLINEIKLPDSLKTRKLTNPDGPILNYCIEAEYKNRSIFACPLIILKEGRAAIDPEKDIMESIEFGLVEVEKKNGVWQIVLRNGEPLVVDQSDMKIADCQCSLAGEALDPNEILAEAFTGIALGNIDKNLCIDIERFKKIISQS